MTATKYVMKYRMFALLVGLALSSGCADKFDRFSGKIVCLNSSGQDLSNVRVEGFQRNPPCGVLSDGVFKVALMGPMVLPNRCVVQWNDASGKSCQAEVDLTKLAGSDDSAALVFEFLSDGSIKPWFSRNSSYMKSEI